MRLLTIDFVEKFYWSLFLSFVKCLRSPNERGAPLKKSSLLRKYPPKQPFFSPIFRHSFCYRMAKYLKVHRNWEEMEEILADITDAYLMLAARAGSGDLAA